MKFNPKIETIIDTGNELLRVHLDYDADPEMPFPILFYTPDMKDKNNHFHIHLTNDEAERLGRWLLRNTVV